MLLIFLQDLENVQVCCQWVPYNLNVVQQWTCCETNLERFCHKVDSLLNWITAVNEM